MKTEIKNPQSSVSALFVKRLVPFLAAVLVCLFSLALFVPGPIQKNSYMGTEYCASCHQAEYQSWLTSDHAKAFLVLPKEAQTDRACLSCHATGVLGPKEGFLKGVQCESCHGPGQYYASLHVKKDAVLSKLLFMEKPNEASCKQCHSDVANSWSFTDAMKKIDHWSQKTVPISSLTNMMPSRGHK